MKGSANAIPNSENVNVTANTGGAIGALVGVSTQAGAIPNYITVEVHVSQTGASLGGLIALHAAVESDPSADAQSMNERIWAELIESTRRRQFQARIG